MDIQQRINKARGAFSRLKNVWRASNINLHLKIKLFNSCVKSILLYGCETWFVTNKTTQKLQAFVNRCLRNILGIWWPRIISNQELWEKTGLSDINVEIKRRKFGWIRHTLRKSQNEICHSFRMEPIRKEIKRMPQSHLETHLETLLKESGRKSFGELRAQANNRVRWRIFVDGGIWRISK